MGTSPTYSSFLLGISRVGLIAWGWMYLIHRVPDLRRLWETRYSSKQQMLRGLSIPVILAGVSMSDTEPCVHGAIIRSQLVKITSMNSTEMNGSSIASFTLRLRS